jgi:hypothetical protein
MANKLYWNNSSGSPFYMVAPPSVEGYVCNASFLVHWDTVWLAR